MSYQSSTREKNGCAWLALALLACHDTSAFQMVAPHGASLPRTIPARSQTSLHAFATDIFLDNLSQVHYSSLPGPDENNYYYDNINNNHYYSPAHEMVSHNNHAFVDGMNSAQTYLDNMASFGTHAYYHHVVETSPALVAQAGMGTPTAANMEALQASFAVTDDLVARIQMAADFVPTAAAMNQVWVDNPDAAAMAAAAVADHWVESATTVAGMASPMEAAAAVPLVAEGAGNSAVTAASTTTAATTIAAMDSAATPSASSSSMETDSLRSQLSDLANSYNFDEPSTPGARAPSPLNAFSQAFGEFSQTSQEALLKSQKGLSQALSSLGESSKAAWQGGQSAFTTAADSGAHVWGGAKAAVAGVTTTAAAVYNAPGQIAESTQKGLRTVTTDLSISQVAEGMAHGLVNLGKTIVMVLNIIIEAISGESLADVVQKAQTAATDVAVSAAASIIRTIHQIGEMTISEALTSIANLVIMVTTVLYRIFSGIVELITGRNVGEWGVMAAQSLEKEASHVMAAASSTATDLSHKSLTELVAMMGHFEQQATQTVMTTAHQVLESVDASSMALASLASLQ